jgi:hypothetical protein
MNAGDKQATENKGVVSRFRPHFTPTHFALPPISRIERSSERPIAKARIGEAARRYYFSK